MATVRTRFAPSPTGELHLGNARIAVLNWLYARHGRGQFVLRIEDTDVERNVPGAEQEILSVLSRLGLDWDEGPDLGGRYAPYRQSERGAVYRDYAEQLLRAGAAYRCYCSPEELETRKQRALQRGEPSHYDGRCRELAPEEERHYQESAIVPSIRFAVSAGEVVVHDAVRGAIRFDGEEFGDFVILKSDGNPTYNFAVVVDDCSMRISHVIRGVGHLANTPRQLMIYRALQQPAPAFVHVPHVLGPGGEPLSKRQGARSLKEYLDEGYHPDALINYLSLLSWSAVSGEEILTPDRLVAEIDLTRIGASDARLDPDKLEWLSGEYIRAMSEEQLGAELSGYPAFKSLEITGAEWRRIAKAVQERITTFGGAEQFLPQFYPPDPMEWSPEAHEALAAADVTRLLTAIRDKLQPLTEWTGEQVVSAARAAGKEVGARGRGLFMPLRAAVTGALQGPELVDIFDIQGRQTTLRVLNQALERATKPGSASP